MVTTLGVSDGTVLVTALNLEHLLLGVFEQLFLVRTDAQIGDTEGETGDGGVAEANFLHLVEQVDRVGLAAALEGVIDDARCTLLGERAVVEGHSWRQDLVEDQATKGGHDATVLSELLRLFLLALDRFSETLVADFDPVMQIDGLGFEGQEGFGNILDAQHRLRISWLVLGRNGQEVHAHDDVLGRADDRIAVRRAEDVVDGHHQHLRFGLSLNAERKMHCHLVAVEVGVVAGADERMDLDGVAFNEYWLESLDTHSVQRWSAVQEDRVILDHRLQDVPHFSIATLKHALGALDGVSEALLLELANDERLIQLKRDLLRQTALPELELWTNDDDRTGRVVNALAEQILAESTLLALDHVGDRLERAVGGAEHRATAAAVVEQRIDSLLKHALLVADDHLGGVQIHQLLETVVAVDDAAIEIVEIAGGKVAALQHDQRTQVRRDHWNHIEHHPRWIVGALADRFHDLQALGEILLLLLALRVEEVIAELDCLVIEVELHRREEFAHCFCAHHGGEGAVAVLLKRGAVLIFREHLLELEFGGTRIGDDVVLEVNDLLNVAGLHGEQVAKTAWHGLEVPNVHDRRSEVDVTHALASHAAVRDLDAAAVANDALVLGALVLAAGALKVALWSKDPLTEQTVALGTVGSVVDGLWLLDFAKAPAADVVGTRKGDLHGADVVHAVVDVFRHMSVLACMAASRAGMRSFGRRPSETA